MLSWCIDVTIGYRYAVCSLPSETLGLSAVPLRKLLGIDDRKHSRADRSGVSAKEVHLRQRISREYRLEQPENPGKERRDVNEELLELRRGEERCTCQ